MYEKMKARGIAAAKGIAMVSEVGEMMGSGFLYKRGEGKRVVEGVGEGYFGDLKYGSWCFW